eukprot:g8559.t1
MGFLSCLGFGRPNTRRPATRNEQDASPSNATPAQSPPATPWVSYQDDRGRPCWYNKETKQTTYSTPYGNAAFPVAVPPFHSWPMSPYPGSFHHLPPWAGVVQPAPVVMYPPPPPPPEEKKEEKSDKKGYWKEVFSEDGEKHWRHTGTNKKTYKDPYV